MRKNRFLEAFKIAAIIAALASSLFSWPNAAQAASEHHLANSLSVGLQYFDPLDLAHEGSYSGEPTRLLQTLTSEPFYFDELGQNIANTAIGSVTVLRDLPGDFSIKIQLADNAAWSDGVPVTSEDLLMNHFVASSGSATGSGNNGSLTMQGSNAWGEYSSFLAANPTISSDGKGVTFNFTSSAWAWKDELLLSKPAHILEQAAHPSYTVTQAKSAFRVDATSASFDSTLVSAWNSLYYGPVGALNSVGIGPYALSSSTSTTLSLSRNPNYSGPRDFAFDAVKLVKIADITQVSDKFASGEIDYFEGQAPTSTVLSSWRALQAVQLLTEPTGGLEHFDIRVASKDGSAYGHVLGGNSTMAKELRRALLLSIPREQLQPGPPAAEVLPLPKSVTGWQATSAGYEQVASQSGFTAIFNQSQASRLTQAKAIVQNYYPAWNGQAASAPIAVNVLWGSPSNAVRQANINLIAAEAAKAGFALTKTGNVNWSFFLESSSYNASMFQYVDTSAQTGFGIAKDIADNNGYQDASFTGSVAELSNSPSPQRSLELQIAAQKSIVDDGVTLPLFQYAKTRILRESLVAPVPYPQILSKSFNSWQWDRTIPIDHTSISQTNSFNVGSTLTANVEPMTIGGFNTISGLAFTYQWFKGSNASPIAVSQQSSSPAYTVRPEDSGESLFVRVRGSAPGYDPVDYFVLTQAEVPWRLIPVTGNPRVISDQGFDVGDTLDVDLGAVSDWSSGVSFKFQWLRSGVPITAESSVSSYLITNRDVGHLLSARITASLPYFTSYTTEISASQLVNLQDLPVTGSPSITATEGFRVGSTLGVNNGTWPSGSQFTYRWDDGSNWLTAETSSSQYTIRRSDSGKVLAVTVHVTKAGYVPFETRIEANALVALPAIPTVGTPNILAPEGFKVGSAISVAPGAWTVGATFTYQWFSGASALNAASTSSIYLVQASDVGKILSVRVRASLDGYLDSESQLFGSTAVTKSAFPASASVQISGSSAPGGLLSSAVSGLDSADLKYQWLRNDIAIFGRNETTYTTSKNDLGATITLVVVASREGFEGKTYFSNKIAISNPALPKKGTVTLVGTVSVGKSVSIKLANWPAGVSYKYQWQKNGSPIKGATKSTYKMVKTDKGAKLSVIVTVSKSGYLSTSVTSPGIKVK